MSWKYYKDGELRAECDDIPETMEDAIILLQENGVDVSDCVIDSKSSCDETDVCTTYAHTGDCNCNDIINDDFWSEDYPPEEEEYKDTLTFKPLTDEEMSKYLKIMKSIPIMKTSKDFTKRLNERIAKECKASLYQRFIAWCKGWTDEEITYLVGWIFILYLMVGVIKYQPSILDVILWPFI